jgi:hypothetical protein
VEGEIDSRAVPGDSTRITVEPRRPWGLTYPARPADTYTRDSLRYPPVATFGEPIADGVLGAFAGAKLQGHLGVGTGPNEGVRYVSGIEWSHDPLFIWINAGLQPDDPWYKAQLGSSPRHPRGCGRAFLGRMARDVPAHEGRHYDIDKKYYEDSTTFLPLESVVEFGGTRVRIAALMDSISVRRKALQDTLDAHDKGVQDCDPYPLPTH